jgi:hypothetical protein
MLAQITPIDADENKKGMWLGVIKGKREFLSELIVPKAPGGRRTPGRWRESRSEGASAAPALKSYRHAAQFVFPFCGTYVSHRH